MITINLVIYMVAFWPM